MLSSPLETVLNGQFFRLNITIRAEHTRVQYRIALRNLERFIGHTAYASDLSDDNVVGLMVDLGDRGLAPKTINERRGRIHTLWSWMARRGYVDQWPTTPRITEPIRVPRAWTNEELTVLIDACRIFPGWVGEIHANDWWTSLHLACWDTGERIGAILQVPWSCADLAGGWLSVPAELRKGKRKDRLYKIGIDTVDAMRIIEVAPRKLIWPWPYCISYLWPKYRKLLKFAGLPTDRLCMFHRMRRSVASHMEAAGGNATEFLGHSNRKVTEAYLDPRIVPQVNAVDLLFRLGKE